MEHPDQPMELVASAGPLDPVVETLRDFLHRSGAVRVVAIVDAGPMNDEPALVDCARLAPIEVQVGDRTVALPHAIELDAEPLGSVAVRQLPAFDVDAQAGEVTAPLGGVEHLAEAVRSLAGVLGGRSVAMVQFTTTTTDVLFSITARGEEPIVLSIGEDEYEMDPGWPGPSSSAG